MKVCTFEPALSCQACSRAKLSTSSLLFDRAILFMSPLTVANYRLDGTVMRCAGENLSTGCDLPLACRKHRSHIPFLHTTQRMVNPAARQWLQSSGLFLGNRQSSVFLGNPNLFVSPSGVVYSAFRNRQGNNAFPCNNVIMRNKNLQHREVEGRLLWLKRKGTRGWKSFRS